NIEGITINAVTYYYEAANQDFYSPLLNDFNEYSKLNNLNITVDLNIFSNKKTDSSVSSYVESLELLLNKKSEKYDLYFFNNMYVSDLYRHFIDLKEYLSPEYLNLFDPDIIEYCSYDNKLIGLPISIIFSVLYSNSVLLDKYNKEIPKTWDEFLKTNSEYGSCSIYQFIYSFKESIDSPFPEFSSQEAIEALEMLKKIKCELSLEYESQERYTIQKLMNGEALFLNYWVYPMHSSVYKTSAHPGYKEGISGSITKFFNVGISKYIKSERKTAALEVLKHIISKEVQIKFTEKRVIMPGATSLYYDEVACKSLDCEIYNTLQYIRRPTEKMSNYDHCSDQYRKYIYEFLYGNNTVTASEALQNVEDLTKIYYISLNTCVGLVSFILFIFIIAVMLLSLIFIFIENFEPYFKFLSEDGWIIVVLGSIITLSSCFFFLGMLTKSKCILNEIFVSFGLNMISLPIFYKLITNFPIENTISNWVESHKYLFQYSMIILYVGLMVALYFSEPYTLKNVVSNNGKNFQACVWNSERTILHILLHTYNIIILLSISVLIFIEWNIKITSHDLKLITSVFSINDYISEYVIQTCIIAISSISNYFLIYGIRAVRIIKKTKIIQNNSNSTIGSSPDMVGRRKSRLSKIVEYHFKINSEYNQNKMNDFDESEDRYNDIASK
ncbi:hypothetical protein PIROE2DRAFT_3900, partial [Piromyces sp. E2]